MYNVILVDDDLWVMKETRALMEAVEGVYRVIQMASNGRAVLEGGRLKEADIVIADINMPEMDGLELIRRIRAAQYAMPIIILSNYSDFGLVREALRLGASDYLLKQELNRDTFLNMSLAPYLSRESAARITADETELWLRILRGSEPGGKARSLLGQYFGCYCVILISARDKAFLQKETIGQMLEESGREIKAAVDLSIDEHRTALLVFSGETSLFSLIKSAWKLSGHIAALMQQEPGTDGVCMISKPDYDPEHLCEHFAETIQGLDNAFYLQPNKVLDLSTARPFLTQAISETLHEKRQALLDAVEEKNTAVFLQIFQEILDEIREKKYKPDAVREWMGRLMFGSSFLLNKNSAFSQREETLYSGPFARLEDYWKWARQVEKALEDLRKIRKTGKIYKAVQLIETSYALPLTLNDAADACGLSRNYFSNLFTATFGEGFMQYLLRVRMKKAAELLRETDMSIAGVAEAVGMEYHQFCRRFRQSFQTTPTDFRREGQTQK